MHSVRYYDTLLKRLERKAEALGYAIDHDPDYLTACRLLPCSVHAKAPEDVLPLLYAVGERVESVRKWKEKIA